MAKKKVQVTKAKKVSSRKAQPKKRAKAAPAGKAKATPKKKPQAVATRKAKGAPKKTQPRKKATADKAAKKTVPAKKKATTAITKMAADLATAFEEALPANQLRKVLRALSHSQLHGYLESHDYQGESEEEDHDLIEGYIKELNREGLQRVEDDEYGECDGSDVAIEDALEEIARFTSEAAELRPRVAELLNKLDDDTLEWLHFEITDPDAEGEIETDEQADKARANFPRFDRPALVQALTTIAVDDFQLANAPNLAETLKDEKSIWLFLTSNKP